MTDPATNGWAADRVFEGTASGYGYDDVVFLPGHVSFEASEADIKGQLTRNLALGMPLVGAPVGTVTEWKMAISLALVGSMGIVHGNQSAESQADMVRRVKRFVGGFVLDPFVLGPTSTLRDLEKLKAEHGVGSVPITDDGKLCGKLIGWVGQREADAEKDRGRQLQHIMVRRVVQAKQPLSLNEAMQKMKEAKVGKLPIVDEEGRFMTLVVRSDTKKVMEYPMMSRSTTGQLLAGAAVPVTSKDADEARVAALVAAGVDLLYVDLTEQMGEPACELVSHIKEVHPSIEVLVGPVGTCRQAKRLVEAGADGLLVGSAVPPGGGGDVFGSGLAAVGRPEASALFEISKYSRIHYQVPIVAGPGVCNVGQMLKAFCLGASAVVLEQPLAGADEAPGEPVLENGRWVKWHHSAEPVTAGRDRLFAKHLPDAVHCHTGSVVACQGSARSLLPYMALGIKNGMQDLGLQSLKALHDALDERTLRLECRSPFAMQVFESGAGAIERTARPEIMPLFLTA